MQQDINLADLCYWVHKRSIRIHSKDFQRTILYLFLLSRWLATDMDDGLIEREITASGAQMLSSKLELCLLKCNKHPCTDAQVGEINKHTNNF